MVTRKAVNRYPRPGQRIAPTTLSAFLTEPVPAALVAGTALAGAKFCDLDETIWDKLSPEVVAQLAEAVVDHVAIGCARRAFFGRHFPRPPRGLRLHQLHLEHRTQLCLAREGFEENPAALGDHTIGEILSIRAFGPRCLVDLLSALETLLAKDTRLHRPLTAEAEQLVELPEAALARSDDIRFASLMSEVDVEARTAKDLAESLLVRTQDPPDPTYTTELVRQLRRRILAMPQWPIEEELIQIFASTPHTRNREIVIGYYGWGDGQCHTLAEIGNRYRMTRERTRQICAKLVKRKEPSKILAPVMDRTLEFLDARLPCSVETLEQEMRESGLTVIGLRLENIESAARLLGRPVPFTLVTIDRGRLAVRLSQEAIPPAITELAKKEIYYHGVARVQEIVDLLAPRFLEQVGSQLVAETLQLVHGFSWLDRSDGWFRIASIARHGLPKAIDKVLAVAGRIAVEELAVAVSRNRRMWKTPPPESMLLEFCRQMPGVRIEGDQIFADPPRAWEDALTGVELQLVRILKEHGPVMDRGALEDLCVGHGMNRFSFHAFIACSPVIAQYGHSIYGLLRADISPSALRLLVAKHRAARMPAKVLDRHGRTEDGRIWLSYRLSKAASTYAVITVPAALKDVVTGKFDLLAPDGARVGVLAAKEGRAWGLGAFLRHQGARIDDYVIVTLDLARREAVIAITTADAVPT